MIHRLNNLSVIIFMVSDDFLKYYYISYLQKILGNTLDISEFLSVMTMRMKRMHFKQSWDFFFFFFLLLSSLLQVIIFSCSCW